MRSIHRSRRPLMIVAVVILAAPAGAQWGGPGLPPGGGGFASLNGIAGGAGVNFNFIVTQIPCTQLYYGFGTNNLKAGIYPNASVPLTYDPSQTTSAQAVWAATLPVGLPGLPTAAPTRAVVTSPTPGVTFLPAPGPIGGGAAVAAIPQDVTTFTIHVTHETFYGGNWVAFSLPWNGFGFTSPASGPFSYSEAINGTFWWYTGGPCATVSTLPSNCSSVSFLSTPFKLGTVGTISITGGLPNSTAIIVYSTGAPVPTAIPPCTVYIDLLTFQYFQVPTSALGSVLLQIPLPFVPVLAGVTVVEQAGVLNPAAPLGIDLTNANVLLVGY